MVKEIIGWSLIAIIPILLGLTLTWNFPIPNKRSDQKTESKTRM